MIESPKSKPKPTSQPRPGTGVRAFGLLAASQVFFLASSLAQGLWWLTVLSSAGIAIFGALALRERRRDRDARPGR